MSTSDSKTESPATEVNVAQPVGPVQRVIRTIPFTIGFVLVFLGIGVISGSWVTAASEQPWFSAVATGLPAFQEGRWWTILTSPFFMTPPYAYLLIVPLLVGGLGWAEWRLGTWRTIIIAFCGHVVGILGAAIIATLLAPTGWHWGEKLAAAYDVGPSCAALAALVFAIATLPSPWRLRARIAVVLWTGISLLYLGQLYDLEHAITMAVALIVSGSLPAFRRAAGRPTVREWRLIALWGVIAIGAMQVIDIAVPYDGPLGNSEPDVAGWDVALDVIIIALVANGLRHGYGIAWISTMILGILNLLLASLGLFTIPLLLEFGVIDRPDEVLGQYIAPTVFWVAMLAFLAIGRSAFRVPLRSSRRALDAHAQGLQPLRRDELIDRIRAFGGGTISWMATWPENSRAAVGEGAVAYQEHSGVGIMLGDPIVPHGAHADALEAYSRTMHQVGLVPCVFSASDITEIAKPEGWRSIVVAEDTIVDLPGLEFRGKSWNHVRTAINRAGREDIEFRMVTLSDEPWSVITQVRTISEQWSGDKGLPEMRFTLGTVDEALDPEARVGIAMDAEGSLHGITSWLPVFDRQDPGRIAGWTLDVMRRRDGGFGPVMEFLIASSAKHFSEQGYDFISLSGAPLVRSEETSADVVYRVLDRLGEIIEPLYGFRSLHRFKQKFNPRHESLHMLYRDDGDLPRIGVALTRAYLPDATMRDLVSSGPRPKLPRRQKNLPVQDDRGGASTPASAKAESILHAPAGSTRSKIGGVLSVGGEIFGILIQLLLVYIGILFIQSLGEDFDIPLILGWCLLATFYLGVTILGLNVLVWFDVKDPPFTRSLIGHPLSKFLSTLLTFGASALGLREAFVLIVNFGQEVVDPLVEFSAIWTMLLSWAMFNWGFSRIYYSRYHRAKTPPLVFPDTPEPRLTDFVYFSFTNATTFAASDVKVLTTRMRWTVVWHTSFAFFFNALIIALSMNVISNGNLFAALE